MSNDRLERAKKIREDIDFISRLSAYGERTIAQSNNLYGIDHIGSGSPAPPNRDKYGMTFFTRPDLNLSYDNLAASRIMSALQTSDEYSLARAIRALLDPRSVKNSCPRSLMKYTSNNPSDEIVSKLIDPEQAFIPLLTNKLKSLSGWPDIAVDTYTSKEGVYKEAYSMVDGTSYFYGTQDITATFDNVNGDPITFMMAMWVHYAAQVYDGTMVPYPDAIINNRIDYNTRIYRLVLDQSHQFVTKIGATGAAFPMASPLGAAFNYSSEESFNRDMDQISIPFKCIGFTYLDPILIDEFNQCVEDFKPAMRSNARASKMVKLDPSEFNNAEIYQALINATNFRAYPRIEPTTNGLEWWVHKEEYDTITERLNARSIINI